MLAAKNDAANEWQCCASWARNHLLVARVPTVTKDRRSELHLCDSWPADLPANSCWCDGLWHLKPISLVRTRRASFSIWIHARTSCFQTYSIWFYMRNEQNLTELVVSMQLRTYWLELSVCLNAVHCVITISNSNSITIHSYAHRATFAINKLIIYQVP